MPTATPRWRSCCGRRALTSNPLRLDLLSLGGAAGHVSIAAFFGQTELVELVLAAGADPMVRTVHGLTALGAAISEGHAATAAILRAAGAHE